MAVKKSKKTIQLLQVIPRHNIRDNTMKDLVQLSIDGQKVMLDVRQCEIVCQWITEAAEIVRQKNVGRQQPFYAMEVEKLSQQDSLDYW